MQEASLAVRHRLPVLAALFGVAVAIAVFGTSPAGPPAANAAPCPAPTVIDLVGNLSISGTPPCDDDPETISVFCGSGTVRFDYYVNDTYVGIIDIAVACGSPS